NGTFRRDLHVFRSLQRCHLCAIVERWFLSEFVEKNATCPRHILRAPVIDVKVCRIVRSTCTYKRCENLRVPPCSRPDFEYAQFGCNTKKHKRFLRVPVLISLPKARTTIMTCD